MAHHADRAESDPLVSADGALVGDGWVERQAVMAALLEEVPHEDADGLASVARSCQAADSVQQMTWWTTTRYGVTP